MQTVSSEKIAEPTTNDGPYLLIGEVSARTGLTQRTIRYYEELGLLPPPTRTHGDFRLFSPRDVTRLGQVARMKKLLGFSLAEIREIVEGEEVREQLRSEYRATEDASVRLDKLEQALTLTRSQLELVDRKLAQIVELKMELESRIARYMRLKQETPNTVATEDSEDGPIRQAKRGARNEG